MRLEVSLNNGTEAEGLKEPVLRPQVGKTHYFKSYDTKERFCSYWTQIQAVLELSEMPVLEIGVGNKFVNDSLKRHGIEVKSMDISSDLKPDVVASVHKIPFRDRSFGIVMACQVLEHLPFDLFRVALSEMSRVTRRYAIVSLPNRSRTCVVSVSLPKIGKKQWLFDLGRFLPKGTFKLNKDHYWEIGEKGYPVERITSTMEEAGFAVVKDYRVFEFPYHHFFVLEKRQ